MTVLKSKLDAKISSMLDRDESPRIVARRLVFYEFSQVFAGDLDRGFSILNEVAEHFHIPISCVRVVGSAQFGYSYFKQRDFTPKLSDLDLAIVNSLIFQRYSEYIYWTTLRYTNLVEFPRRDGVSAAGPFREYLSAGYLRPDLMPESEMKEKWFSFFNQLSNKHSDVFKNINGGIFMSEGFLEMRNANLADEFRKASK